MWFDTEPSDRWNDAIAHLRRDPILAAAIKRVGPCTLRPKRNYFVRLVQSILSQQVSVKAAAAMYLKLSKQFPRKRVTPEGLHNFLTTADEELIRSCGLSRQKRGYLTDLSRRFADGEIETKKFSKLSDDEIVAELTKIKGIGRWTTEMLLMFSLCRPDVWPVDDLGLQEAVRILYNRPTRPTAKELQPLGDPWRPYRSIAAWYLWRAKEG